MGSAYNETSKKAVEYNYYPCQMKGHARHNTGRSLHSVFVFFQRNPIARSNKEPSGKAEMWFALSWLQHAESSASCMNLELRDNSLSLISI